MSQISYHPDYTSDLNGMRWATVNQEGRQDVVQHPHPNNINAHMDLSCTAGTTYNIILVDISDVSNFKHNKTDYVHIENLNIQVDSENNASYNILFGWLENVTATQSNLHEFSHILGTKQIGNSKEYQLNPYPNGPRLSSDFSITSDIDINTSFNSTDLLPTLLNPTVGTTASGDGDFVMVITSNSGANSDFDIDVTFAYHTH